jgi:hypothetical protein
MKNGFAYTGIALALSIITALPASAQSVQADIERLQTQIDAAQHTAACAASGAAPQTTVSPRMAELVEIYRAAGANIDALDPLKDEAAWTAAESNWEAAEVSLMNEQPATVADFALKFDVLMEIDASEGEFARLKRLSEDANTLAGCVK